MDYELEKKFIREHFDEVYYKAEKAAIKAGRNINDIKIIAVSKTQPAKVLEAAAEAGLKYFGENYVQELTDKYDILSNRGLNNIEWHFIGHLQTNKVRFLSHFIDYIHSVDSYKLAEEISKRAGYAEKTNNILVQINTSNELSKSGCDPEDAPALINDILKLPNINVKGLMTIGTFTDDEKLQRTEFSLLRKTLNEVNEELGTDFKELSMGMTGDYEIAIDEGATMVRIGTAIFGSRIYKNF